MPDFRAHARLAAVLMMVIFSCAREEGPVPVAWDRTRCAQCGMLVSDPAFAAQRHSTSGEVFHYDDPGCLLVTLDRLEREGHADGQRLYFHHLREDRWLRGTETVFVEAPQTPMNYGFGAVARGEDARTLEIAQAIERAIERDRERNAR